MDDKTGVVLVGHGSPPSDFPQKLIKELKELEAKRLTLGSASSPMSSREADLDLKIRLWPRNPETDPYWAGLTDLAEKLKVFLASSRLEAAYMQFCTPSLEEAAEKLIKSGCSRILVATVMMTRGGSHSERDIPQIIKKLQSRHPDVRFVNAWPYDPANIAELIARHLRNF